MKRSSVIPSDPVAERNDVDATDVNLPPDDNARKRKYRVSDDGEITFALDERGHELPDPVPMAPPVGYRRQPSMFEVVRDMVKSERLRAETEAAGFESFEDADDFVIGDDYDPHSPYEAQFEGLPIAELRKRQRDGEAADLELRKRYEEAVKPKNGGAVDPPAPASGKPAVPQDAD